MIRIGLDSNVLAYLAGVDRSPDDGAKVQVARAWLAALKDRAQIVAPTQTLGELFTVLVRAGATRDEARTLALRFRGAFEIIDCGAVAMSAAFDLAVAHRLPLWDSLIISAAADAGCQFLLSEDMQDGFAWRGLTLINPFAGTLDTGLARIF